MKQLVYSIPMLLLLQACGPSTRVTKSWRDPSVTVDRAELKKVLFVGLMKDESSRRIVEDKLVQRSNGKGVASYTQNLASLDTSNGGAAIEAKLKADGYDGGVVLRLVQIEKEMNYVPGSSPTYYGRFGGYYGGAYGAYGSSGYYQEDKTYTVEINVYSLKLDKLIWSGTTATTNPTKMDKTIQEIADVVNEKMRSEGFLKN